MRTAARLGSLLLGLLVAVLLGLVLLAFYSEHAPEAVVQLGSDCGEHAQAIDASAPFTVLSWNLQYGAGRGQHFFYDGGEAVHVPAAEVSESVAGIVAALSSIAPHIALLQEVDRGSSRTQQIDQLPAYAAAVNGPCAASTAYHRSPFVPHPLSAPMGRVDMHLAMLTRPRLENAVRHALPLLRESRIRQVFNLKRALLVAELPIAGSDLPLAIAVSHLSAFSKGDGTLEEQLGVLKQWMDARPAKQPWVLGADLNALPPGDDPKRFGDGKDAYRRAQPAMSALLKHHKSAFDVPLAETARTWLPYGASQPDRKIDWLFYGGPLELLQARVHTEYSDLSDHLPLVADFRFTAARQAKDGSNEPI